MGYLDRYRRREKWSYPDPALAPFIENALNKITVQKLVDGEPAAELLEAVLIFKDRDGPDSAKLYTYAEDGLQVGDVIVRVGANNDRNTDAYFMLAEEEKRVDGSKVIKVFGTYEVNSWVTINKSNKPAYILSNLKKSINTSEVNHVESEIKTALMVVPAAYGITVNQYLTFINIFSGSESYAGWRVEGIDDISSPFIHYIQLAQELKVAPPEEVVPDDETYPIGSRLVLNSLDGYIQTDASITIIKRTSLTIEIRLPSKPGEYALNLRDANGDPIPKVVKVV